MFIIFFKNPLTRIETRYITMLVITIHAIPSVALGGKGALMAREQLQTLSEPMYFTLLALAKPRHGYETMQAVSDISRGRLKVGAGTLYALLTRFEKEGVVRMVADDGRRKTYELTEKGRGLLDREYERLKSSVAAYDECFRKEGS
jgi:DNA-binding PadR family transcriptional regulator